MNGNNVTWKGTTSIRQDKFGHMLSTYFIFWPKYKIFEIKEITVTFVYSYLSEKFPLDNIAFFLFLDVAKCFLNKTLNSCDIATLCKSTFIRVNQLSWFKHREYDHGFWNLWNLVIERQKYLAMTVKASEMMFLKMIH